MSADRLIGECIRLRVYNAEQLLARAASRVGWEYCHRLVEFFKSKPGAWGAGALRIRLQDAQPGLPVEEGWPPPRIAAPVAAVPTKSVDHKLQSELRWSRAVKALQAKLQRLPTDEEVRSFLEGGDA